MGKTTAIPKVYTRINIYLHDPELRTQIKIAAARQGVTVSAYCLGAILDRLQEQSPSAVRSEGAEQPESPQDAAQALDRLRRQIGRVGVPVRELIAEGRYE